jgi:hypothetical protein
MTLSMNAAQFLRSAHQSWSSRGAFKGVRIYRVSGLFRGSMQPGRRPDRPAAMFQYDLSGIDRAKRPWTKPAR